MAKHMTKDVVGVGTMARRPSINSLDPDLAMWQAKAMHFFVLELYEYFREDDRPTSEQDIMLAIEHGTPDTLSGRTICVPIIRALATEIALKAWQGHEKKGQYDFSHDLVALFDSLTSETRSRIEQRFNKLQEDISDCTDVRETTVRDLLCKHRDIFENWRYTYEYRELKFDALELNIALTSIIEVYNEVTGKKSEKM